MLGDHIRALKDGRWLHGIDLGDQRVLYLAEAPGLAPGDRLRRVYRPEFTAGASKVELVVHREPAYPAKAVVARAWSRFMDPSVVSMFRDSEAFAAWCKIGRLPESTPAALPPRPPEPARAAPAPAPQPTPKAPVKAPVPAKQAAPARKAKAAVPAKKAAPKKKAAAKPAPKKAPAKKAPAKKPAAKAKRAPAKKAAAKKAPARKAAPKKAPAKKQPGKKKGRR